MHATIRTLNWFSNCSNFISNIIKANLSLNHLDYLYTFRSLLKYLGKILLALSKEAHFEAWFILPSNLIWVFYSTFWFHLHWPFWQKLSRQGKNREIFNKNSRLSIPLRTNYDKIRDYKFPQKLNFNYFATLKSLFFCFQLQ